MGHRVYKIRLRLWSRQLIVLLKCCTYLNIERDRGLWRDEIRKTLWNFICDTQNFQFCEVSMQFVNQHRSARYVESSFQFIAWKKSNDRTSWTNEIGDLKKKKKTQDWQTQEKIITNTVVYAPSTKHQIQFIENGFPFGGKFFSRKIAFY